MSEPKYKLVPVEPTLQMISAAMCVPKDNKTYSGFLPNHDYATRVFRAILAAAPSPQDPRDESLRVAREALQNMNGSRIRMERMRTDALRKIKELMGEK